MSFRERLVGSRVTSVGVQVSAVDSRIVVQSGAISTVDSKIGSVGTQAFTIDSRVVIQSTAVSTVDSRAVVIDSKVTSPVLSSLFIK